jgi:hypothetical protein
MSGQGPHEAGTCLELVDGVRLAVLTGRGMLVADAGPAVKGLGIERKAERQRSERGGDDPPSQEQRLV